VSGFQHAIAGGQGNLVAITFQSPNFVHLVAGWQIAKDGSAEFNNLTFRGTFMGTDYVINSTGLFFYSPSEGAGNLIMSVTASTTGGTDAFGNHYVPLTGWYDNSGHFFTQMGAGFLTYGTGSLAAGWTANTSIQNDASGDLFLDATASIFANGVLIS
jgi:hypothetical protein